MVIGIVLFSSTTTTAQSHRDDRRERRQEREIRQGVRNGTISKDEKKALIKEQNKIARYERRSEGDGQVTGHERRKMDRKQDKARRDIKEAEKH